MTAKKRKLARHERPLWRCPKCGKQFANPKNWHSCVVLDEGWHFDRRPKLRPLYEAWKSFVERFGAVTVSVDKTRITFMHRVRFAGVMVRRDHLRCSLWLTRPELIERFVEVVRYLPYAYVHSFELRRASDLDRGLARLVEAAAAVGRQEHLASPRDWVDDLPNDKPIVLQRRPSSAARRRALGEPPAKRRR